MINLPRLITALGGPENIETVEPCITRLRVEVVEAQKVNRSALKSLGTHGVTTVGNVIQVVVGPNADTTASDLADLLWEDDPLI